MTQSDLCFKRIILAAVWRTDWKGQKGSYGTNQEANSAVQTSEDSSQEEANSDGGGEKWLDQRDLLWKPMPLHSCNTT